MKRIHYPDMTLDQLVKLYCSIGIDQDKALLRSEYAKFNGLFEEMDAVENELRGRGGDQRRELLPLFEHPNAQVRLNAMKATLAVAPETARRALEGLAASREFPQAGDAGMSLINLDRGIFKPT
jgi:hypothetical protein